jgi:hypothetical protein
MLKLKEKGQALIEFVIFLPFMLMMFTVVLVLGNAINGSINQQKAARGYFYYRLQNNSSITRPNRVITGTMVGHYFIGWADYLESQAPVAPCYKLKMPFAATANDKCDEAYAIPTSQHIRVGTVYGACGATVVNTDTIPTPAPTGRGSNTAVQSVISITSCLIQ